MLNVVFKKNCDWLYFKSIVLQWKIFSIRKRKEEEDKEKIFDFFFAVTVETLEHKFVVFVYGLS